MNTDDQNASTEEWPELAEFKQRFRAFVAEREWEQFHSPKNLAMALAGEAGELLELFQWLTQEESRNLPDDAKQAVARSTWPPWPTAWASILAQRWPRR